jgi:hypothetical protein
MIEMAEPPSTSAVSAVSAVFLDIVLIAVVCALACLTVGWLLPLSLQILVEPVQVAIDIVAAAMLLPEYWLSRASRRIIGRPPQCAYQYGNAVAGSARLMHSIIDHCFRGLEAVATAVPLELVVLAAGGITIMQLLG